MQYTIVRNSCGSVRVMVFDRFAGDRFMRIERSQRYRVFAGEFDFGNHGGGARQLAFAILVEETRDPRQAEHLTRSFVDDYVSLWTGNMIRLTSKNVQDWIASKKVEGFVPA